MVLWINSYEMTWKIDTYLRDGERERERERERESTQRIETDEESVLCPL